MAEDITIVVDDDTGAVAVSDGAAPAAPTPVAPAGDSPQTGIEELKRKLEEESGRTAAAEAARKTAEDSASLERNRAAEAERRERDAREAANTNAAAANDAQYNSVVNAIEAVNRETSELTTQFAKLQEEGKFAEASQISVKLGRLGAKLETLEAGKADMEQAREQARTRQPTPTPTGVKLDFSRGWDNNEFEAYLRGRTPTTAAWLRDKGKAFASDVSFRNRLFGAHNMAVAESLAADTPEYFKRVEQLMGTGPTSAASTPIPAPTPTPTPTPAAIPTPASPVSAAARPVTPSAPVSRDVPGASPGTSRGTAVTLTSGEVEMANIMFPKLKDTDEDPLKRYARHKIALQREGKIAAR